MVDCAHHAFEVGHHAAGKAAAEQQRTHEFVVGVHEIAEEVVDELLGERTYLHVSVHVDFGNVEAGVLEHALHGDNVRVYLSPRKRFDSSVDYVGTCAANFQY